MSKFSTQEGRQPQAASGHKLWGSLTALRLTQPLPRSPSSQPNPRAELRLLQLHAPFVSSKALALKPDPGYSPSHICSNLTAQSPIRAKPAERSRTDLRAGEPLGTRHRASDVSRALEPGGVLKAGFYSCL